MDWCNKLSVKILATICLVIVSLDGVLQAVSNDISPALRVIQFAIIIPCCIWYMYITWFLTKLISCAVSHMESGK